MYSSFVVLPCIRFLSFFKIGCWCNLTSRFLLEIYSNLLTRKFYYCVNFNTLAILSRFLMRGKGNLFKRYLSNLLGLSRKSLYPNVEDINFFQVVTPKDFQSFVFTRIFPHFFLTFFWRSTFFSQLPLTYWNFYWYHHPPLIGAYGRFQRGT